MSRAILFQGIFTPLPGYSDFESQCSGDIVSLGARKRLGVEGVHQRARHSGVGEPDCVTDLVRHDLKVPDRAPQAARR